MGIAVEAPAMAVEAAAVTVEVSAMAVAVCLAGWLPLCRFACEHAYATRVVQGGVRMTLYVRSTRPGFRNNEDPAAGSKARWRRQGFTLM